MQTGKQVMIRVEDDNLSYLDNLVIRLGLGNSRNSVVNMLIGEHRERDEVVKLREQVKDLEIGNTTLSKKLDLFQDIVKLEDKITGDSPRVIGDSRCY